MDGCCTVKYPPQGKQRAVAPPQQADGGVRAIFGRNVNLVYPPSGWTPAPTDSKAPDCKLIREYVYGYNASCKHSLRFISDEECMYPVAALVIIQNLTDTGEQRFFEGHDRGVNCLDYNEQRKICASGQKDPKGAGGPYVCIWAPAYCDRTICQLHHHSRQVTAVSLSPDGRTCVSFGDDDGHTMCIWRDFARWDGNSGPERDRMGFCVPMEIKAPVFHITSGRSPTRSIYMHPCEAERGQRQQRISFYTVGYGEPDPSGRTGTGHFKFWTISLAARTSAEEPEIIEKRGVFGKGGVVPRLITDIACARDLTGAFMVGDNGYLYMLSGGTVTQSRQIVRPAAPLGCVAALAGGRWIAGSATGDIFIGRCDPVPRVEETFRAAELVGADGALFCSTASMKLSELQVRGSRLLLGTSNYALFTADLSEHGSGQVLQVSHSEEAWAMDFHPTLAILATASSAKDVRFWNVAERQPAVGKVFRVDQAVEALAFNPEGSLLALGCAAGVLEVHGFPSLQPVFQQALSRAKESFVDVRFSDDGRFLAAANWDQAIYLLKVTAPVTRDSPNGGSIDAPITAAKVAMHKVLSGNSSSPLCVMFSADGEYLMSNSKDTQILFWKTKEGSLKSAISSYRDMAWQTPWTCLLGWQVLGLWGDPDYDQTDINTVCQSSAPNGSYIAMGDDYGKIKLFRFPSPLIDPPCHMYGGHASHVTRLKFSRTNVLAALGGDDHSISQWSLDFSRPVIQQQPEPLVHPWMQVEEARGGPRDQFGFLGRPRAASASRIQGKRQDPDIPAVADFAAPDHFQRRRSMGAAGSQPEHRPESGRSSVHSAAGPGSASGRRPASASGVRRSRQDESQQRSHGIRMPRGHEKARPSPGVADFQETPSPAAALPKPASRNMPAPRPGSGIARTNASGGVASALRWD